MSETVHTVTDVPAKASFSFNPKVIAGVAVAAVAVGALVVIKGKLPESTEVKVAVENSND